MQKMPKMGQRLNYAAYSNFQTRLPDGTTNTCNIAIADCGLAGSPCIVLPASGYISSCDLQLRESSLQFHRWYNGTN